MITSLEEGEVGSRGLDSGGISALPRTLGVISNIACQISHFTSPILQWEAVLFFVWIHKSCVEQWGLRAVRHSGWYFYSV